MSTGEGFTPEDQVYLDDFGKRSDEALGKREKELRENFTWLQEFDEELESKLLQNDFTVEEHLAMLENGLDTWIKSHPDRRQDMLDFLATRLDREDLGPTKRKAIKKLLEKANRPL